MWTRNICIAVGLIAWSCLVATVAFKTGKEKAFNKCDAWIEAVKALENDADDDRKARVVLQAAVSHRDETIQQYDAELKWLLSRVAELELENVSLQVPRPPVAPAADGHTACVPGQCFPKMRSQDDAWMKAVRAARSTEISPARANWPRRVTIENSSTDYGN